MSFIYNNNLLLEVIAGKSNVSYNYSSIFLLNTSNKGNEQFNGVLNSWLNELSSAYWNLNL